MSTASEIGVPHQIISVDGSIVLEARHKPGYIHELEIEERWPRDIDRSDVWEQLSHETYDAEEEKRKEGEYVEFDYKGVRRWLGNVTPNNAIGGMLKKTKNFRGILDGLGYEMDISSRRGSKNVVTRKVCRYPSTQRLNDFMLDVFGNDQAIEFADHQGGSYGVDDFMESFAREGKVLMASDQPFQIHDLSDHALGWMGMTPEMIRSLRSSARRYLDRSEVEIKLLQDLPPQSRSGDNPMDNERTRNFFNPSRLILIEMMSMLDRETEHLAHWAFEKDAFDSAFHTRTGHIRQNIVRAIGSTFDLQGRDMQTRLPHGLLGEGPEVKATAAEIYERYRRADEAGREMAAAA